MEKNTTLSKKLPGKSVQLCSESVGVLCYYSDDSLAETDNNTAEQTFHALCLGKKNYVFFSSAHGRERDSLLGICHLNCIALETYLRYILSILPDMSFQLY